MSTAWHSKEPEQVLSELKVGPKGLEEQEAKKRIEEYGYNELTEKINAFIKKAKEDK